MQLLESRPSRPRVSFTVVHEPSDYWTEFRDELSALGLEPVLVGALAAIRYRSAQRATTDVDFLVRSLAGVRERFEGLGCDVRVIVHKLLAWRPRDRDDVASILAAGHDLDVLSSGSTCASAR